jgi:hypothetical protein
MLRRLCLAVGTVVFLSSPVLADSGLYVGFHGGASGVDVSVAEGRLRLESKDFAWKAFGGFGLGRFVALETGYVSFGRASDQIAGVDLEQKLWGWDTAGLLKLNLGPVDFYGRIGGIYWKATVDVGDGLGLSKDGFDVNYGGGIGVNLGQLAIRGEMVWYDASEAGDPWMASAGVTLGF